MQDPLVWQLILQLFLILLNAIFACAEIAVISFKDTKLSVLAEEGDVRAVRLTRLTSQPSRFLATIQVAITLAGFMGSAFAADHFSERLVALLMQTNLAVSEAVLDTLCVILITLILSFLTLVFGELVPKRLAMKNSEKIALSLSGAITFISKVFAPLVFLLTASTNGVLRLLGVDPSAEDEQVTEEEIRMMIDVGSEKGTIDQDEKRMLQNVFEFNDVTAGELATHRTQVDFLWMEDSETIWDETIHKTRHSFYPICQENTDRIVGILDAKDYFRMPEHTREQVLAHAVIPPRFVPESIKADDLFSEMKKTRNYFWIVLDEYGGVTGIVTLKDLLEILVGAIAEEEELEPPYLLEQVDDTHWRISGSAPLSEVSSALGLELPEEEFETFGGLVFSTLLEVPEDGRQFESNVAGLHVRVLRLKDHRILEAEVCCCPTEAAAFEL